MTIDKLAKHIDKTIDENEEYMKKLVELHGSERLPEEQENRYLNGLVLLNYVSLLLKNSKAEITRGKIDD